MSILNPEPLLILRFNSATDDTTTHTYDYADRQVSMTTYGAETATTTWAYSPNRGFLTRKQYHDGNGTDYTYTAAGRLATRAYNAHITHITGQTLHLSSMTGQTLYEEKYGHGLEGW